MARRQLFLLISLVAVVGVFSSASASSKKLVTINENNWREILEGEWMLEFYAPWCPACKSLQTTWEAFAGWGEDLGIKVAQCDVTKSPGLSGRFLVTALPTIYHVKNGVFRQYQGSRDKDAFISFVEDKRWEVVEPVPFWQDPSSFHMTIVSEFFRFSNYLRDLHKSLVEDYGVTTWGSYALFGVTTIVVGALLGLILVCVIDYVNPPKPMESLIPPSGSSQKASQPASPSSQSASVGNRTREDDENSGTQDDDSAGSDGDGDQDRSTADDDANDEEEPDDDEDEENEASEDASEEQDAPEAAPAATTGPGGDAQSNQPRRRPRRAD
jgi:thiol-disulfide isomerase/thioredoxin